MKLRTLIFSLLSLLIFACATTPGLAKKKKKGKLIPDISVESFFRPERVSGLKISPDGQFAAGTAPIADGDEIGLVLINLNNMEPYSFKWSDGYDIYKVFWGNNETVVFQVIKWNTYASGLYKLDRKKKKIEILISDDAVVRVVDRLEDDPKHILVWIPDMLDGKPRIARLRLSGTAMRTQLGVSEPVPTAQNHLLKSAGDVPKGKVFSWYADKNGQARLAHRYWNETREYVVRESEKGDWVPLSIDPEEWHIVGFSPHENLVYAAAYNGEQTTGLYFYDIEKDEPGELLFRDDYYDYLETSRHRFHKGVLLGVNYDKAVPSTAWFSDEIAKIQSMVDGAIRGRENVIYDWSDDFSRLLINSYSDTEPRPQNEATPCN